MKFNTKTRYGIRAMLEISMADREGGIYQKDIAQNQGISVKYLDHIISSLKVAGLIRNARGKNSGYRLARSPAEITTYDIYRAFNYDLEVNDCVAGDSECARYDICSVKDFWIDLNRLIVDYLRSRTLEDLRLKERRLLSEKSGN